MSCAQCNCAPASRIQDCRDEAASTALPQLAAAPQLSTGIRWMTIHHRNHAWPNYERLLIALTRDPT